jgi:CubicO group peptidase (beta-lactamase class C family)
LSQLIILFIFAHNFIPGLIKFRKILIATLLIAAISYDPGAVEKEGPVTEKLVPANIRVTNSMSDLKEFTGLERTINSFMRRWEITGASVAVAKDGRLVFAKGFGFSDRESNLHVEPYNKFRIASISKLVTAVAIMRLSEQGRLSVYDKVFGPDGILSDSLYSNPKDKRVYNITVAHLLSHEGGWTTRWGDQMFMPLVVAENMGVKPPVDTKTIVSFALSKNLHFSPGTGRAYSNLGYAILGLVIEKVTGMSYLDFCRREVLEPLGIYDMTLAKNRPEDKAPFEVRYYEPADAYTKESIYGTGEIVAASYGGNDIETLGGAGAWIATAPDLMKLLLAVDGMDTKRDILSRESIDFMTDGRNGYAPLGWKTTITDGTWWRTGTFPGSACMMKRQPDGMAWIVLLNSSAWNGPEISTDINYMMVRALSTVKSWPDYDLFAYSLPVPLFDELYFK